MYVLDTYKWSRTLTKRHDIFSDYIFAKPFREKKIYAVNFKFFFKVRMNNLFMRWLVPWHDAANVIRELAHRTCEHGLSVTA